MIPQKPVIMCVCYLRTFEEVKQLAQLHGWTTVAQITQGTGCGSGCGMCRSYLARMLETGETAFAVMGLPLGDR